jgi:MoaA/NifB/PqqE/SkfB family radical SAM enzyme
MDHVCTAGVGKLTIKYNGDVLPCPAFKEDSDFVLGNIYKDTMEECYERGITHSGLNLLKWFTNKPIPDPNFDLEKAASENPRILERLQKRVKEHDEGNVN